VYAMFRNWLDGNRDLYLINRIIHLDRIGNIAVGFVSHKSIYELMPNAG
jgi:hypothetical protein